MKKLTVSVLAIGAVSLTACAQKLGVYDVPTAVKESFSKQFLCASPKWEKENSNYEAGFKQQGYLTSALFEANGTFTELETAIKISELPAAVAEYIKKYHAGKKIKEAAKITKANGEISYEAEVNGKDLIFDADGNFVKQVKT